MTSHNVRVDVSRAAQSGVAVAVPPQTGKTVHTGVVTTAGKEGPPGPPGPDEVWVSDEAPTSPTIDLWLDTDEEALLMAPVLIINEGDTVTAGTPAGTIVIVVPAG